MTIIGLFVAVAVVWKLIHWLRWLFSKSYRQKVREKKAKRQRRKARRSQGDGTDDQPVRSRSDHGLDPDWVGIELKREQDRAE